MPKNLPKYKNKKKDPKNSPKDEKKQKDPKNSSNKKEKETDPKKGKRKGRGANNKGKPPPPKRPKIVDSDESDGDALDLYDSDDDDKESKSTAAEKKELEEQEYREYWEEKLAAAENMVDKANIKGDEQNSDDDDSLTGTTAKVNNVPLLEWDPVVDGFLERDERKRKATDVLRPLPPKITSPKVKTLPVMALEDMVSIVKPNFITEKGQTFPLRTKIPNVYGLCLSDFLDNILDDKQDKKPDADRINVNACYKLINECMQRPGTKGELNKRIKQFSNDDSKLAYSKWCERSEAIVDNEVDLRLLSNNIRLRYIPIPGRSSKLDEDTVRGTYEAMIIKVDGTIKKIKVANDWVEDNFTEEAIATVQRVAYQSIEVYKDKHSSKTEKGYLSLVSEPKTKKFDKRQISQIRYLPAKQVRRPNGEMQILLPAWKGMIQTNRGGNGVEFVMLTKKWVDENIAPSFQ